MQYARKTGRVFPDIIIHRRGKEINCAVIEAKPSNAIDERVKSDENKLRAYKKELGYHYAIQVTFHIGNSPQVTWNFID